MTAAITAVRVDWDEDHPGLPRWRANNLELIKGA